MLQRDCCPLTSVSILECLPIGFVCVAPVTGFKVGDYRRGYLHFMNIGSPSYQLRALFYKNKGCLSVCPALFRECTRPIQMRIFLLCTIMV